MKPALSLACVLALARAEWNALQLRRAAKRPAEVQERVLRRILRQNRDTDYGRDHGFAGIENYSDFRRAVPIQSYEDIRPYIDRQIETGRLILTPSPPVFYATTSGTTGKPKFVPVLSETQAACRRAQRIAIRAMRRANPQMFSGPILAIVGPAIEGRMIDNSPYGAISGLLYSTMPPPILARYLLPPEIFDIEEYESRYIAIALLALAERGLSTLASPNPTTLLRLIEIVNQYGQGLADSLATGQLGTLPLHLDDRHRAMLENRLRPLPERADELRQLLELGPVLLRDIWPSLRGVVTWTGGNTSLLLARLKSELPAGCLIIEMGYMASEFVGNIVVDCARNDGVPTLLDHFFEFVEKEAWERGERETRLLHELETGRHYYVIVTALHGLYRYFIDDIVEAKGRYRNTPTIAFVQKGKGVTSLTGEKLYECQITHAVDAVAESMHMAPEFFMMLADQRAFNYVLYVESASRFDQSAFGKAFNQVLGSLNVEYRDKCASGRIGAAIVKRLRPGTAEMYKRHAVRSGQREGQFKVVRLQYLGDVEFCFDEYCAP